MLFTDNGVEYSTLLKTGDIFCASIGTEHVAHPLREMRVLVIKSEGSVEQEPQAKHKLLA